MEAVGLPVPAALALLFAGGASANGTLEPVHTILTALSAMLAGDFLMYVLGRYTGWWLLGVLCRLSLNPESCILRAADLFYERGRTVLLFAKFIPGVNTMAPPLAGSMNMNPFEFAGLDFLGAGLYTGVFWGVGFAFSGFIGAVAEMYAKFGNAMGFVFAALFAGWLGWHAWRMVKARNLSPVRRVSPAEVMRRREAVEIFDVRSHGYYERGAQRIAGSRRLDPHRLHQERLATTEGKELVLYCTCFREATAEQVARDLAGQGIEAAVLAGSFQAWKKAGLPVEGVPEGDMVELPRFR